MLSETSETSVNQSAVTAGDSRPGERSSCCKKIKLLGLSQGAYRSFKGQRLIYKAASGSRLSQIQCLHRLRAVHSLVQGWLKESEVRPGLEPDLFLLPCKMVWSQPCLAGDESISKLMDQLGHFWSCLIGDGGRG